MFVMDDKKILIRKDYGKIELTVKTVMDEKNITRGKLARLIDTRFEVVDKLYKGELEKVDLDILARVCFVLNCNEGDLMNYTE